jgi:hypothetical protein
LEAVREEKGESLSVDERAGRGTAIFNHDDEMIGVRAQRWQGATASVSVSGPAPMSPRPDRIGRLWKVSRFN